MDGSSYARQSPQRLLVLRRPLSTAAGPDRGCCCCRQPAAGLVLGLWRLASSALVRFQLLASAPATRALISFWPGSWLRTTPASAASGSRAPAECLSHTSLLSGDSGRGGTVPIGCCRYGVVTRDSQGRGLYLDPSLRTTF